MFPSRRPEAAGRVLERREGDGAGGERRAAVGARGVEIGIDDHPVHRCSMEVDERRWLGRASMLTDAPGRPRVAAPPRSVTRLPSLDLVWVVGCLMWRWRRHREPGQHGYLLRLRRLRRLRHYSGT